MSVNSVQVQPVISGPSNNLALTYTPANPYPSSAEIPVTIYACDIIGNCMDSAVVYSFTTEPPDLTPPVISNINVLTTDVGATITWTTDETADSTIEYGLTTSYESTPAVNGTLVTQHTMNLTGLLPNTNYNYRISSADFDGNTKTTTNLTFHTKQPPGAIYSDDFGDCTIDTSVWSFINPKGDATMTHTGTGIQLAVPAGVAHDLWRQGLQAPRLMQFITNQDFDVEVKFDTLIDKKTQSMGILVQQDASNWLRFNFQNDGVNANSLVVVSSLNNIANAQVVFTTPVTLTPPSYMRLNRAGDLWNVQYSTDGTNWTFATSVTRTLNVTQIGPYIGNTGSNPPQYTGVIDYFENLDDP
jgi:regulation of enolase protein 1 (concanavalin A-like superfamily)